MRTKLVIRTIIFITVVTTLTVASRRLSASTGTCSGAPVTLPFTDVLSNTFFCQIAEAYFSGLTNGTSATTYSPTDTVTREQMAAFVTRAMDQSLKRGSERAALDQFLSTQAAVTPALTNVASGPRLLESDGADVWVAGTNDGTVTRVRASDGAKLGNDWTGAAYAYGVLIAMGKVFITGSTNPGRLYQLDPAQPAGAVTSITSALGPNPSGIAFDGQRIWTANFGATGVPGSVSIITVNPLNVTTITTGFSGLTGIVYDGANMWVTDVSNNTLKKLDSNGNILLTVDVGTSPLYPAFDGTNIWVPNSGSNSVSVIRASGGLTGTVLATLTLNGLNGPRQAAFDGERILVTNVNGGGCVSLWTASDLLPMGFVSLDPAAGNPFGACSDGLNFWVSSAGNKVARF